MGGDGDSNHLVSGGDLENRVYGQHCSPQRRASLRRRDARARDRQTKPFASASALALALAPSSRAGPENQLSNASRLVASTRGLRRVVTRVSLAYPLAGFLEPPKEVDSRLVVCAVSKSIYSGRVTDPRVTLFGYGDNNDLILLKDTMYCDI